MQYSSLTVHHRGFFLGVAFLMLFSAGATAREVSCRKAVGEKRAERLVSECVDTETSIHAPCNVNATCSDIEDSVKFGCSALQHALLRNPGLGVVSKNNKHAIKIPKYCAKYLAEQ